MKLAIVLTMVALVAANVIPEGAISVPKNPLVAKEAVSFLFSCFAARSGPDTTNKISTQQCTCAGATGSCTKSLGGFCQNSDTFNCKGGHWVR
jgi:hypothetical protein